jgi:hypothetical protein
MELVPVWYAARPEVERRLYQKLVQTLHKPTYKRKRKNEILLPQPKSQRVEHQVQCIPYIKDESDEEVLDKPSRRNTLVCPFTPAENALVSISVWADVVGLYGPHVHPSDKTQPFAADASTYWMKLRAAVNMRIRSVFVNAIASGDISNTDLHRWTELVVEKWGQVHQVPSRYGFFFNSRYPCDLHTLCVMYDLRNIYGLRVPRLKSPEWFGEAEMYEMKHEEYVTILEYDPLVARFMAEKLSLSKTFSRVAAEESTQQVVEVSKQKAEVKNSNRSTYTTNKKSSAAFIFNNKDFARGMRLMRRCLFEYDHITHHYSQSY